MFGILLGTMAFFMILFFIFAVVKKDLIVDKVITREVALASGWIAVLLFAIFSFILAIPMIFVVWFIFTMVVAIHTIKNKV